MRIKRGVNAIKKRRKILKQAKGYWGAKSKLYRVARQAVMKSQMYAYVGRKNKKRDFRKLWIARINAAARMNGLSYSKFMYGLKKGFGGPRRQRRGGVRDAVREGEGVKRFRFFEGAPFRPSLKSIPLTSKRLQAVFSYERRNGSPSILPLRHDKRSLTARGRARGSPRRARSFGDFVIESRGKRGSARRLLSVYPLEQGFVFDIL